MNSTPNKASLWKSCVEQGIFDTVPPDSMYQVQGLFERVIEQFQGETDIAKTNPLVLKEFRFQLGKLTGKTVHQKSFEELNNEYREQYQPAPPAQIEFSREKDSPIQDLESILKEKAEQRKNEIQEFFKEGPEASVESNASTTSLGEPSQTFTQPSQTFTQPLNKVMAPFSQTMTQSSKSSGTALSPPSAMPSLREGELDVHRRILESILKSQLQIIELLQRK